jgi:hypothetical protein
MNEMLHFFADQCLERLNAYSFERSTFLRIPPFFCVGIILSDTNAVIFFAQYRNDVTLLQNIKAGFSWWTQPPHFLRSTLFSLLPKEACIASAEHLTCAAAPSTQCFFFFPLPLASVWCSCYVSLRTDFVSSTLERVQLPTLDFCQCHAIPLIGFTSVVPTACPSPLCSSELRGSPTHI